MLLLLLLFVAAILLFNHFRPFQNFPQDEATYAFVITSAPHPTAKCERFETQLIPSGNVYLYLLRDSTKALPSYGDTIIATTRIEWFHTVGRAFAFRYAVRPAAEHKVPLQVKLYNRLSSAGLSGEELATVGALTLGYKEDLDPALKRRFQVSGAAHVLAVSGLHTGIIYALLIALLTCFGYLKPLYENRLGRWAVSMTVILCLCGYAWLTGLTPSVVRAVLMLSLVEIGRAMKRNSLSVNTIASAAVLILIARPTDLWSVSFQLSFAATFAIILIVPHVQTITNLKSPFTNRQSPFTNRQLPITNWFLVTLIISIAAQLGTMPITMYYFGQMSTCFLLTNLIVLPLATLLVPCGLVSIALGGSAFGILFTRLTYALAWLMNHSVAWLESLPYAAIPCHISPLMAGIYYMLLLALYFLLFHPNHPLSHSDDPISRPEK